MINKAINGIKYWGQLVMLPVYWLSFITPRSKRIWLFGSTFGRRFADNPRYLYLYATQHRDEIYGKKLRPIWISHNKSVVKFLTDNGYEAYYHHSFKGIWYCLRGGIYIFDNYSKDISFWLSGGAVKFNLWHGVGNKKINHDNIHDKPRHPNSTWEKFLAFPRRLSDEKPSHYILSTSPVKCKIFASAFQVSKSHVIENGLPRNDMLLGNCISNLLTHDETVLLKQIHEWKKQGKIIDFYMPTFRDSEKLFFKVMDLEKYNTFLKKHDIVFVMKLHPKSKLREQFKKIRYSNIISVNADIDPYSYLKYVDILTTDYSSIYTDFMLLDKPVVGFYYDFKEYSVDTRECYFDFDSYMPERKATTMQELMQITLDVLEKDECRKARSISRDRMFSDISGDYCEKLISKIKTNILRME